jgi:TM2 domain-containing membrane protein YozV/Tfp pilus assembly major pilin PilA
MEAVNPYNAPTAGLESDQKICESCGARIKAMAEICPACGVRQRRMVSKVALLLLTFFLGGLGAHKFYLGKWVQGIFYLLFSWTYIPGLIALIEFVVYAFTSEERLNEKYTAHASVAVVAIVGVVALFVFVAFIGVLAAIALPAYQDYTVRARMSETIIGMSSYKVMVGEYFADKRQLPVTGAEIDTGQVKVPRTQSVKIAPGGAIVAVMSGELDSRMTGKTLVMVPRVEGAGLTWTCGVQESSMMRYLPASCRNLLPSS